MRTIRHARGSHQCDLSQLPREGRSTRTGYEQFVKHRLGLSDMLEDHINVTCHNNPGKEEVLALDMNRRVKHRLELSDNLCYNNQEKD